MLFDRTLQAATGLLDAVENGQYGGNMTTWNLSSNSGGTTMLRCGHEPSKMIEDFSINKYNWSQDDWQLIDESLEGGARDRSLFDNAVNRTHVRRYGKRDVIVSFTWSYDATDSFA